jgi:hypothetical protein
LFAERCGQRGHAWRAAEEFAQSPGLLSGGAFRSAPVSGAVTRGFPKFLAGHAVSDLEQSLAPACPAPRIRRANPSPWSVPPLGNTHQLAQRIAVTDRARRKASLGLLLALRLPLALLLGNLRSGLLGSLTCGLGTGLLCSHFLVASLGWDPATDRTPRVCCKTYIATYGGLSTKKLHENRRAVLLLGDSTTQTLRRERLFSSGHPAVLRRDRVLEVTKKSELPRALDASPQPDL